MDELKTCKVLLAKSLIDNHADGIRHIETADMFIIHGNTESLLRMFSHKIFR
ncbi:Uncharacterised protein [Mycobacterium tuberculosis]|nr:Uncharacterised protein [Mycobacterium tuberculosis]